MIYIQVCIHFFEDRKWIELHAKITTNLHLCTDSLVYLNNYIVYNSGTLHVQ